MKKILAALIPIAALLFTVTPVAAEPIPGGTIEYGSSVKHSHGDFILQHKKLVFHEKQKIAWLAVFSFKTTTSAINLKIDYAKDNKTVLQPVKWVHLHFKKGTSFRVQDARSFASLHPWDIKGPGIYQLQYLQGKKDLLAYGNFVLKR